MSAQQYEIHVFGQAIHVTSEKSEDHVRTVAAYVDGKMRERARVSKTIMPLRVAIMTALGIAEELFDVREQRPTDTDAHRRLREEP